MAAYLTPAEVAARWACSPTHVRRLCRAGRLAAMRLGSDWRIGEGAVAAYEARHTVGAPADPSDETPKPETSRRREEVRSQVTAVGGGALPADFEPVFPDLWGRDSRSKTAAMPASPAGGRGRSARKEMAPLSR